MTKELKISRIGNSRGMRIPAETLTRYHMGATVPLMLQRMVRSLPFETTAGGIYTLGCNFMPF